MTGNGKRKNLLMPKLAPKLHNAFAILSQPDAPTTYKMSEPELKMDDDYNDNDDEDRDDNNDDNGDDGYSNDRRQRLR